MRGDDILQQANESMTVKRVFGEPIEVDGVTVIPVARVSGGGGGGGSEGDASAGGGSGFGYGLKAEPVGAYVVRQGELDWEPAQAGIDLNKAIISGSVVAVVFLLVMKAIIGAKQTGR